MIVRLPKTEMTGGWADESNEYEASYLHVCVCVCMCLGAWKGVETVHELFTQRIDFTLYTQVCI